MPTQGIVVQLRLILPILISFGVSGCSTTPENSYIAQSAAALKEAGDAIGEAADTTYQAVSQTAASAVTEVDDAWIASNLKGQYILDEYIDAGYINIEVEDGHIALFGRIQSNFIHERAILMAKSLSGTKSVTSHLVVMPRY
jgi:osmotically-inducible protein OsmY